MSSSKLLEQAIVDAQALRDSAYKSAQAALVEKFAPQIKEAVQKLLEQEEEQPAGMEGSPEDALAGDISAGTDFGGAPPDTSNKGYVAGTAKDIPLAATDGEKLCPCPDDEEDVTLELNLADLADQLKIGKESEEEQDVNMQPMLGGMQNQPPAAGGTGLTESIEIDEDLLDEEGEPGANIHDESMHEVDEELTEVNLDEILFESEESEEDEEEEDDEDEEEEDDEDEEEEDDEDEEEEDDEDELDEGKNKPKNPQASAAAAQGTTVEKLKAEKEAERERLADMRAKNRAEAAARRAADETSAEVDEEKSNSGLGSLSVKKGIDNNPQITRADVLAGRGVKLKESKEVEQTKQLIKASSALLKEVENKDAKINKLLEENKKSSSIIEEMSQAFKKLEEVNTLNARLFYENQVLKSASLNERQKTHIVEAISKADSVSEAKTVYETLINSVGGQADKERSPKSLNEAINKKSSFRLPHKQTEQPNDPNKDRWLKLAGIK